MSFPWWNRHERCPIPLRSLECHREYVRGHFNKQVILTTSHILVGQWLNGKAGIRRLSIHSNAHSIALADAIHVESREGCVGLNDSDKQSQQDGPEHVRERNMDHCDVVSD